MSLRPTGGYVLIAGMLHGVGASISIFHVSKIIGFSVPADACAVGGLAAASIVFLLPARKPVENEATRNLGLWARFGRLDYVGSAFILAIVTCLLLALQWGGNQYPWSNWRIIILFVFGGLIIILFIAWNWTLDKKFDRALIPLSVIKNRTLVLGSVSLAFVMFAFLGGVYQIPLYYQAVSCPSPQQSGATDSV